MRKKILVILLVILLGSVVMVSSKNVRYVNSDITSSTEKYNISMNFDTLFIAMGSTTIKLARLADEENWTLKSDVDTEKGENRPAKLIFVKALTKRAVTSLTIITSDNKIYSLELHESNRNVDKRVLLANKNGRKKNAFNYNNIKVDPFLNKKTTSPINGIYSFLRKMDYNYIIKKNYFNIDKVVDDGVFTYIYAPQNQIRPALFLSPNKKGKKRQPLKHVDKGDILVIHRILVGKEIFVLKYGKKKITKIYRK